MEYVIKIKDKKIYDSVVKFLQSLGISVSANTDKSIGSAKHTETHNKYHFNAICLKTKGVKFNREEANER